MVAGGTAGIHVHADKMLQDSKQVIQADGLTSMDQPLLLAQPFEHRASEWGPAVADAKAGVYLLADKVFKDSIQAIQTDGSASMD